MDYLTLTVVVALIVLILLPIIVYTCVKFGTVAFFKGRYFFNKSIEENDNGKN